MFWLVFESYFRWILNLYSILLGLNTTSVVNNYQITNTATAYMKLVTKLEKKTSAMLFPKAHPVTLYNIYSGPVIQ